MSYNWFHHLAKRKLVVKTKRKGFHKGMRVSSAFGYSFDFSDYRQYELGDDPRRIDWNVYARTEKLYIKRFLDEQEISVVVYLDSTTSMTLDEKKWEFAKLLAAAFGFIALNNEDRFTFLPVGEHWNTPPLERKGSSFSKNIVDHICELPKEKENSTDFSKNMEKRFIPMRDLTIIITDAWEPIDQIATLFQRIAPRVKEVRFLHILGKEEIAPPYERDVQLVDSEQNTTVNVSMSNTVVEKYKNRLHQHIKRLEVLCRRYKIHYLQVVEGENLHKFFLQTCIKHGWLE
ncbi:DUF58 domain-containing protein [Fervidibacillus halotolerans]|uniref:DUF58 domain-containing protein n=1 Tax=Fervidibacillus halotolerans TaxID=2980027 RepID=A0A9E8M1A7_9BACI|nr:DUF58 domain-containing protein [Fervidibacillus halotolerans]WAA13630.1 DUF58 domain-containing protein [Fervidibacillus halotolerans]